VVLYCDYPSHGLPMKCWKYAAFINIVFAFLTHIWCVPNDNSLCPNLSTYFLSL
jgi:hypothetical protein